MHRFASGKLVVNINKGVAVKNSVPTKKNGNIGPPGYLDKLEWVPSVRSQIGLGIVRRGAGTNCPESGVRKMLGILLGIQPSLLLTRSKPSSGNLASVE